MSLISKLSAELIALPSEEIKKVMVVFPNRRAGLFLRRQMSIDLKKPGWLPEILSVEEAFARWSGFAVADSLTMITEIIRQHMDQGENDGRDAVAFIGYARQMAADFDDVDHYLADPEALFQALSEAKAAETWHPDGSPLSNYELAYLRFFRSLLPRYRLLKQRLTSRGLMWQGAMAAHLASLSDEQWLEKTGNAQVWFAGFNALTPAEEKVATTLCRLGKAKMFWDLDDYYMNAGADGFQQAGAAMRRFRARHPHLVEKWQEDKLASRPKRIKLVAASGAVAQAKALGMLLQTTDAENHLPDEAIVLADEKLLEPVLNSIPGSIGHINVTMGYPLAYSPLFQLAEKLARLAVHRSAPSAGSLPLLLMTDILLHPVVAAPEKNGKHKFRELAFGLIADGSSNVLPERLNHLLSGLPDETRNFVQAMLELRNMPAAGIAEAIMNLLMWPGLVDLSDQATEQQFDALARMLNAIAEALRSSGLDAPEVVPMLISQLGQNARIRFSGEPLRGLQVMGMLETRNLSFRRVHLLSANEGSLPPAKNQHSLIPADIRRHFGLPLPGDVDAISAFHFYQLLQNADEIVFYYNTEADALGGGEMSRYLLQIRHELMRVNSNISWEETTFNPPLPSSGAGFRIEIEKNEAVLDALARKAESGLSPSALSRWLNCSLEFYLGEILGIKEKPLPGELPGYNITGTIIHRAIELLYEPLINTVMDETALKKMKDRLDGAVEKSFSEILPGVSRQYGRNALLFAMIRKMVERVVETDLTAVSKGLQIKLLQQELRMETPIASPAGTLRLRGYPDRIDADGNRLRIIDFKTGKFDEKMLKIGQLDELGNPEKKYAFQLACYVLMAKKSTINANYNEVSAYILPLKYHNKGLRDGELKLNDSQWFASFEEFLASIHRDMLDPAQPIAQTQDTNRCKYCNFITVCNRESLV